MYFSAEEKKIRVQYLLEDQGWKMNMIFFPHRYILVYRNKITLKFVPHTHKPFPTPTQCAKILPWNGLELGSPFFSFGEPINWPFFWPNKIYRSPLFFIASPFFDKSRYSLYQARSLKSLFFIASPFFEKSILYSKPVH
uniref:Uncharacterized protein n=1 Tax=Cacopsylla melanoneura TaxID=428564 RepID=A0A8D9E8Y1_9HEMI